jgi:predicted nicotinamide N-methyase
LPTTGHWARVAARGLDLLEHEPEADATVVLLFSLLHDAAREQDGIDDGHGRRAAELARALNGDAFTLDAARLDELARACAEHTDGTLASTPTIAACWDADRLDLGRYGKRLLPERMSTARGRELAARLLEPIRAPLPDVLDGYRAHLAGHRPPTEAIERRVRVADHDLVLRQPARPSGHWSRLWESGLALAAALAGRDLAGMRVLELGCGLGLPSIVAALHGATVTASDRVPHALRFTEANATANGATLETIECDWAAPEPLLDRGPWDLIVAGDVLWAAGDVQPLIDLLPHLVADGGDVAIADPGRVTPGDLSLLEAALDCPAERALSETEGVTLLTFRSLSVR